MVGQDSHAEFYFVGFKGARAQKIGLKSTYVKI